MLLLLHLFAPRDNDVDSLPPSSRDDDALEEDNHTYAATNVACCDHVLVVPNTWWWSNEPVHEYSHPPPSGCWPVVASAPFHCCPLAAAPVPVDYVLLTDDDSHLSAVWSTAAHNALQLGF